MQRGWIATLVAVLLLAGTGPAAALTLPFTETFDDAVAAENGWTDNARDPADHFTSGGVDDSGFIRTDFNFSGFSGGSFGNSLVVTRGEDNDDASGDAFVGDWIANGVSTFTAWVRHDAGQALDFFVRFSSSFNFPGAIAGGTTDFEVPSGVWTPLLVDIDPNGGPWISFEGSTFQDVFSSVGNVQFGIDVPDSFLETDVTVAFDTDDVSIVPEPGMAMLLGVGLLGLYGLGRPRRHGSAAR